MSTQAICAAIVTYNTGPSIRECVNSVRGQVGRILLVDNGSNSQTVGELKRLEIEPGTTVIYNTENRGIAAALNQGVRFAFENGFQWVLTLDHDSQATPGMVGKLLDVYRTLGEKVGIAAANPYDCNAQLSVMAKPIGCAGEEVTEVKTCLSSGSLITRVSFEKAGFFNESLFLYYVDDDFCLRLRNKDLSVFVRCDAILLHKEGAKRRRRLLWRTICDDGYKAEARYYIARNAIHMMRAYRSDRAYCKELRNRLLRDATKVLLLGPDRFSKVEFILKGLSDGVRGRYGRLNSPVAR